MDDIITTQLEAMCIITYLLSAHNANENPQQDRPLSQSDLIQWAFSVHVNHLPKPKCQFFSFTNIASPSPLKSSDSGFQIDSLGPLFYFSWIGTLRCLDTSQSWWNSSYTMNLAQETWVEFLFQNVFWIIAQMSVALWIARRHDADIKTLDAKRSNLIISIFLLPCKLWLWVSWSSSIFTAS